MSKRIVRILLEMRPAMDGYAGIPQETRLLFRGLSMIEGFAVEGLIQHGSNSMGKGLPNDEYSHPIPIDDQINRLSRVVIMLEQGIGNPFRWLLLSALRHHFWQPGRLTRFEANYFRDFIWRKFFSQTLSPKDFDVVTRATFQIAGFPWKVMNLWGLTTLAKFGRALYPRLDTSGFDVMIAETPYPGTVSPGTRLVIRYHDAIPLLMPHTIAERDYHQTSHYHALRLNVKSGAWFACVSDATRNDLLTIFPQLEARSLTIHNTVSQDYFDEASPSKRVPEIVKMRLNINIEPPLQPSVRHALFDDDPLSEPLQYLLMVSTIEPRKNHLTLLSAWERLRVEGFPNIKLLIVGALGWHHEPIVDKFRPWLERGALFLLQEVPSDELRLLYKHARATVCPSFAEGFDFSGVEAMKSGGAVVASDIAVHREIYLSAAEFFNPYSVDDLRRAIEDVISPANLTRRDELVAKGAVVSQQYSNEAIMSKWQTFLTTRLLVSK